ncbi:MAG: carboxypeptidase regulatory-like domain-containing protein, partial [bacterium]
MYTKRILSIAALALLLGAGRANAQADTTAPRPTGARTIIGVVRDTTGQRVDSVELLIPNLKKKAVSKADGTFRFDDVDPGRYAVSARRIGYLPQVRFVVVGNGGGGMAFDIVPVVHLLQPVLTNSARGGLSGVVGDTAYNVLAGAEVWVITSGQKVFTDSTGKFFMDIHPGKYMIRVSREGYGARMMSVSVPEDSGRRVVMWLAPTRFTSAREAALAFELSQRLLRRNPMWSTVFTHDDIVRGGFADLAQVAVAGAHKAVDESCDAVIDGGTRQLPIWALTAADLEYVEVYAQKPARNAPTSINPRNSTRPAAGNTGCTTQV